MKRKKQLKGWGRRRTPATEKKRTKPIILQLLEKEGAIIGHSKSWEREKGRNLHSL